jgi:putative polyhydroxyalkanoate system protein
VSRLAITRQHSLTAPDARERIDRAALKITERFGARCHWQGEVLKIEHASVAGEVTLGAAEITVLADLKFPLALFRARAEAEIARILDRELGP